MAAVAVASGVEVSLWLTGESAWFALPGRAAEFELPHAAPLPELIAGVQAAGRITLCTQCAARRGIEEKDVTGGRTHRGRAGLRQRDHGRGRTGARLLTARHPGTDRRARAEPIQQAVYGRPVTGH